MKGTHILGSIILIVVVGVGVWGYGGFITYAPKEYVVDTPTGQATVNTTTKEQTLGAKTFTQADITSHNNVTSCYTIIRGSVYDLTLWVNMHPGGKEKILSLCGTDGTKGFTMKHQDKEKPASSLSRFKIGTLSL